MRGMDDRSGLRISELAKIAGVSTRAIRHYHHAGVLPEPARSGSGYRLYGLADVLRLLRVRRLVALGLSLAEVSDALTDGDDELREILQSLRADLAVQERRIAERREAVEALLARSDDLLRSEGHHRALARLREAWPAEHAGLAREDAVGELLEPLLGAQHVPVLWRSYEAALADPELVERMQDLSARFEALTGQDPQDPAVDLLAREAGDLGPAVRALLPADVLDGDGDPAAADRMLRALTSDMDPAQARCLTLMFGRWKEQSA